MGFFKSIKKKLSIFKKQLRKILPNELMDNPEILAALIIGGSMIPFGQTQQSLFARGASSMSTMYTNSKEYFTDLNDKFGFGKKYIPSKDLYTTSSGIVLKSKPTTEMTGFLGKSLEGVKGFLEEHPKVKKGASSFLKKYLKGEEKDDQSAGDRIQNIQVRSDTGRRLTSGVPHQGFKSASAQIRPGYRNRYVQSSVYNILSNPNYKAIWSGGINSGDIISIYESAGPITKLESSKI